MRVVECRRRLSASPGGGLGTLAPLLSAKVTAVTFNVSCALSPEVTANASVSWHMPCAPGPQGAPLETMVAVVGLISIVAPWTCQWPTKIGLAVAVAGLTFGLEAVLWAEIVSWTVPMC